MLYIIIILIVSILLISIGFIWMFMYLRDSIKLIEQEIHFISKNTNVVNNNVMNNESKISEAVSHINSIYKDISSINTYLTTMKDTINDTHLKCGDITNNIAKYIHADNENRNKDIINCLANTSNDLRTLISEVNKRVLDFKAMYITDVDNKTHALKTIIDDIKTLKLFNSSVDTSISTINNILNNRIIKDNEELLKVIDNSKIIIDNIYQTVHGNTVDIKEVIKLISSLDLTKISSAFEKLQNVMNYIDEQKETPTELKTVTKSKSTKSGKPASKKKVPLL